MNIYLYCKADIAKLQAENAKLKAYLELYQREKNLSARKLTRENYVNFKSRTGERTGSEL